MSPTLMRRPLLVIAVAALGGCDALSSGPNHDPMSATGRVVLAETGEPVVGLGVAVVGVSYGVPTTLAQTRTGSDGRFSVSYDPPEPSTPSFDIGFYVRNNHPYNNEYDVDVNTRINPGDRIDLGTVEVRRNAAP